MLRTAEFELHKLCATPLRGRDEFSPPCPNRSARPHRSGRRRAERRSAQDQRRWSLQARGGKVSGRLAQTSTFEVCDAPEGQSKVSDALLAHRMTGPFVRSQTPQNGVCATRRNDTMFPMTAIGFGGGDRPDLFQSRDANARSREFELSPVTLQGHRWPAQ